MSLPSSGLDAFFVVAQLGSFTRAASRLHVTQSALSQRVLNLEAELETALFLRERSGIRLTPAGESILRYCQLRDRLESELLGAVGERSSQLAGHLRVAGFSSVTRPMTLPALSPLLRSNPGLELSLFTRELSELPTMLRKGEADFILLDRDSRRDDIESLKLGEERYVLVQRKGYRGPDIYLDHDPEDEFTLKYLRTVERAGKSTSIRRRYLDDTYGIHDGVRLGLGRAVLPTHMIGRDPGLEVIQPDRFLAVPVYLHFYRQPYYTRLHQKVVDALTSAAKKTLV